MFCSPFDEALAAHGPPAVFLLDREGLWRFAPNWTRDAWNVSGEGGVYGKRWVLARDRDSGFVQCLLCTGANLLRAHPRHDLRHFETEAEARDARDRFGDPTAGECRLVIVSLWLCLALASAAPEEEATAAEVVVYSDHLIERARNEVVQTLAREGYSLVQERDGYTVLAHRNTYRGQVRLYDDGRMEVRRQGLKFGPHRNELLERNKPLAWLVCLTHLCIRPGGPLVSKRRFKGYEDRVVRASEATVHHWNERLADRGLEYRLDTLPEQLQTLWDDGLPIDGSSEMLATYAERRVALRAFWSTRTDTDHGRAVREAVEGFVRGVVQASEHPYPPDARAWFRKEFIEDVP